MTTDSPLPAETTSAPAATTPTTKLTPAAPVSAAAAAAAAAQTDTTAMALAAEPATAADAAAVVPPSTETAVVTEKTVDAAAPAETAAAQDNTQNAVQDDNDDVDDDDDDEEEDDDDAFPVLEDVPALLESGAQASAVGNHDLACDKLSLAVQLLSAHYGESAPECADALFQYGRALLALGVEKNTIIQDERIEAQSVAAARQILNVSGAKPAAPAAAPASASAEGKGKAPATVDDAPLLEAAKALDAATEGEDGLAPSAEIDLPPGDDELEGELQLAWETLDLARVIYQSLGPAGPDAAANDRRIADIYALLGDVSFETENWAQARTDLAQSLLLKQKLLPADSRELAEVHYKMALVAEYAGDPNEAARQIRATLAVLEAKRAALAEARANVLARDDADRELAELDALIPDMQAKLADVEALEAVKAEEDKLRVKPLTTGVGSSAGSSAAAPAAGAAAAPPAVHDLSSLVRSKDKRKAAEPAAADDASESKKPKA
ncbi:hypothetical protein CXG81DRAFT_26610 [Caulochytrium protostelioides]|uniref:Tetratricopeptide SHNi-TPR domain-containing protein n=1 Tax=Caulochytrium protostelioides TaxID=1555241 RepID=A0A4P9X697_9FUNG|nr:hypothetical protein CXG81DRAFT_26610 [Caulochytrium protostelioides]|eukprot:RKP00706.1 hypothetical protein CXG81DRAFT_26610 [Caulochytrium protostelioides]